MLDALVRWRHSHGFGVHSPSAFRLIREVINPPSLYAYYAYADIEAIASDRRQGELLRLIFRLMLDFRPRTIALLGDDEPIRRTIKFAHPSAAIVKVAENPEFIIVSPGATLSADSIDLESHPAILFCRISRPQLSQITSKMTAGHIFSSPTRALLLPNPSLPLQHFPLNL